MTWLQRLLTASLVPLGVYTGILVLNPLGLFPALHRMEPGDALAFWQALDHFMRQRMPPFGLGLLALEVGVVIFAFAKKSGPVAWCTLGALGLLVVDVVHTLANHLPINQRIQSIPAGVVPEDFGSLLTQMDENFQVRLGFIAGAFLLQLYATHRCASRAALDQAPSTARSMAPVSA